MLDLEVWVSESHDATKVYGFKQELHHSCYEKECSSKLVMIQQSAMPESIKANTNSQEVIRRYMNCGHDIGIEERLIIMNTSLKNS